MSDEEHQTTGEGSAASEPHVSDAATEQDERAAGASADVGRAAGGADEATSEARGAADDEAAVDEDPLTDHEYDGIREYDNPMPQWWKATLWACVVFSAGYWFHYHMAGTGESVADAYAADVATAQSARAARAATEVVSEELLAGLLGTPDAVSAGAAVFEKNCVTCHSEKGQGLIGPNLTDDHWIHGEGKLMDIYKTVNEGVVEKGMIAWGNTLPPAELRQVVAYVGSIRGTNVPGKAPEGKKVGAGQ